MRKLIIGREKFLLLVIVLNLFWLFALYPARLNADTSALLQGIRLGKSTDWWTGSFYWFLRITSLDGRLPVLTSATQLTILTISVILFLFSLNISQRVAERSILIFFCTPIFGFFGMTLSHDLTQTSGILLLVANEFRNHFQKDNRHELITLSAAGIFLSTVHSGPAVMAVALIFILKRKGLRITFVLFIGFSTLVIGSGVGLTKSLQVYDRIIPTSELKYYPALGTLKCIAQHPESDLSIKDWQKISPKTKWLVPFSCAHYDPLVNSLELNDKSLSFSSKDFLFGYLRVVSKNPSIAAMSHIQRSRGVLPPLLFQPPDNQVELNVKIPIGQGTNVALQSGPELLHPSNDLKGEEDGKPKIFNLLEIPAQGLGFLANQASWFWGWGGLWLLISVVILFVRNKEMTMVRVMRCLYPLIFMHILLLYFAPSSIPRYYMYSIMAGVMLLISTLVDIFDERKASTRRE
jgi:hypothetical protein